MKDILFMLIVNVSLAYEYPSDETTIISTLEKSKSLFGTPQNFLSLE